MSSAPPDSGSILKTKMPCDPASHVSNHKGISALLQNSVEKYLDRRRRGRSEPGATSPRRMVMRHGGGEERKQCFAERSPCAAQPHKGSSEPAVDTCRLSPCGTRADLVATNVAAQAAPRSFSLLSSLCHIACSTGEGRTRCRSCGRLSAGRGRPPQTLPERVLCGKPAVKEHPAA